VEGKVVDADSRRFGFHNLRHSLASFLVTKTSTDVKTVQDVLRHADAKTTLDDYTHSSMEERLTTQAQVLVLLKPEHGERVQ
jgi:integrase